MERRPRRWSSFKYLRVHISEDLSWTIHTDTVVKKARQRLYHLRQLSRFKVSQRILISLYLLYRAYWLEPYVSGTVTAPVGDRRALQRLVRTAERTMGTTLPPLHDLYTTRCTNRARRIIKDPHHSCKLLLYCIVFIIFYCILLLLHYIFIFT